MSTEQDIKVVIKNEDGQYLSMVRGEISFVDRKERAFVYDLEGDRVEKQLFVVEQEFGGKWSWEELGNTQAVDGLPKSKWDGQNRRLLVH